MRPREHQPLVVGPVAARDRERRQRGRAASSEGARARRRLHAALARPRPRRRGWRRAARSAWSERLLDDRSQAVAEVGDVEARGVRDARRRVDAPARRTRARPRPARAGSGASKKTPVSPSTTVSRTPPSAQRDDRPARRLGLDGGDAELLGGGHDERPRASRAACATSRRSTRPVKRTVGPASRCRRRASGPLPTTTSGRPQLVERAHRDVDALVGHQLGEHDVLVADRRRREAADLHRRVQHGRLAAEVARDALRVVVASSPT